MIPSFVMFYAICFTLEIIFFNSAHSIFIEQLNNTNHNASSWQSGRSKRSLIETVPYQLKITMKYGMEMEMNLNWNVQRYQYLANEYLPVTTPFSDFNPLVMENIGEFVLYQDVEKCSAVVYFKEQEALYGVIGTDYYIVALPYNFNEKGEYQLDIVGEPYLQKRQYTIPHILPDMIPPSPSDVDAWQDYLRPQQQDSNLGRKRTADCHKSPSNKQPRIESNIIDVNGGKVKAQQIHAIHSRNYGTLHQDYYSEILVFITHDLADIFQQIYGKNHYIGWIVKYHIIYFNAVDMIFQKLRAPKVKFHINIAKIIIEDKLKPFPFMDNHELQFNEIIRILPEHMKAFPKIYPPDAFDHVFISTSRPIYDDDFLVNGRTKYGHDLYEARKYNEFYTAVPKTVMTSLHSFADYMIAVHEIGRTLNLKIDPYENGLTPTGQCHGIMQRDGAKCMNCLKWSDESQEQFAVFFNGNRNRCFLMNPPRSVRPRGISRFIPVNRQCQCFGYSSSALVSNVKSGDCNKPLSCNKFIANGEYQLFYREDTVKPFDGTGCGTQKACWGGKCEKVSSK